MSTMENVITYKDGKCQTPKYKGMAPHEVNIEKIKERERRP